MMFRVILLSLGVGVASGCGPPTPLMAEPPEVESLARRAVGGSFELALLDVTDDRTCGKNPKFNDLCVSRLRSALDVGVSSVLRQFIDAGRPGDKYTASFQLLKFTQEPVFVGEREHPNIVMRWRFELKNEADDRLLLLTDASDEAVQDVRKAHDALQDVLGDVMERIGEGLNDAEWKTRKKRPMRPRPPIRPRVNTAPTRTPDYQDAGAPLAPGLTDAAAPDGA